MTATTLELLLKRDGLVILASLTALAALAWLYLLYLSAGMATMDGIAGRLMGMPSMARAGGGGIIPDALVNFLLLSTMWIVMMVGMMLPSAAATILLFAALERKRQAPAGPFSRTGLFILGYFIVWGIFSIAAALAQTLLSRSGLLSMGMATTSTLLGGAVFILAGLYELTPLKRRCLTHCRSPLEWIAHHQRPGGFGALGMGMEHGLYCVGCCWMLMLLLFVGAVMNLIWVAAIAAIVLAQKLLPHGPTLARLGGIALTLWGVTLIGRALLSA